eukprot:546132_1
MLNIFIAFGILSLNIATDTECDNDVCPENESKAYYISESSDFDDNALNPTEYRTLERPPHVVDENKQIMVNFHNLCATKIILYWLNGESETFNGEIQSMQHTTIGTYIGHKFFYRLSSSESIGRLQITTIERDSKDIHFKDPDVQSQELIEFNKKKQKFREEYFNKTGNRWIAYYPRDPPKLHMFAADFIGQTHTVLSNNSFYNCYPITDSIEHVNACRDNSELIFEWKIESILPRVMSLGAEQSFLSEFEISHIISIANKSLNRSTIGQDENIQVSYSRTSKGTWLQRHDSEVIDTIFRRIADVTMIDESHLWPSYGCEQLQVLKYDIGEQFYPHPDYNVNKKGMRFLTFLMYLNDVEEGGETEFTKIHLKVAPKKGNVVAFYSVLEDGNADHMSIHAGLPIIKGIKWASPLWIWDPYFER